jgi:hypothetical protein
MRACIWRCRWSSGTIARLLMSEQLDFSLVLVLVLHSRRWSGRWMLPACPRRARGARAGAEPGAVPLPVTVDYARSFAGGRAGAGLRRLSSSRSASLIR